MLTIKFILMFFMCFIVLSHGFSILFWIRTSYYAAQLMGRSELTTTYTDNENHKIKWGKSRQIGKFPFSPLLVRSSHRHVLVRYFFFRSTHFYRKWTVKSNEQHNVYLVLFVPDCCKRLKAHETFYRLSANWINTLPWHKSSRRLLIKLKDLYGFSIKLCRNFLLAADYQQPDVCIEMWKKNIFGISSLKCKLYAGSRSCVLSCKLWSPTALVADANFFPRNKVTKLSTKNISSTFWAKSFRLMLQVCATSCFLNSGNNIESRQGKHCCRSAQHFAVQSRKGFHSWRIGKSNVPVLFSYLSVYIVRKEVKYFSMEIYFQVL